MTEVTEDRIGERPIPRGGTAQLIGLGLMLCVASVALWIWAGGRNPLIAATVTGGSTAPTAELMIAADGTEDLPRPSFLQRTYAAVFGGGTATVEAVEDVEAADDEPEDPVEAAPPPPVVRREAIRTIPGGSCTLEGGIRRCRVTVEDE